MLPDDACWLHECRMHTAGRRDGVAFGVDSRDSGFGAPHGLRHELAVRINRPGATASARLR
jgi:hypothetical protein